MDKIKHAVLIVIDTGFNEIEAMYAKYRLEEEGYRVFMIGPKVGEKYVGRHGCPCPTELSIYDVQERHFAGIIIPGGWAPAKLRLEGKLKLLISEFFHSGKTVATICHGGWVAISAGICHGMRMTGSPAIMDDLRNAGAIVEDVPAVTDRNLVTGRATADLPEFLKAVMRALAVGVAEEAEAVR